jgi:uncharacterized glyoxalase superfamily protein PhnB
MVAYPLPNVGGSKNKTPLQDTPPFSLSHQNTTFNNISSDELAYLHHGNCSFLLQNFYQKELAENLVMHLSVKSVDAWWGHVQNQNLAEKYKLRVTEPEQRPWKMRDFVLIDPSGVLWRISENTE